MTVYVVTSSSGRELGRLLALNLERAQAQAAEFRKYLAPGETLVVRPYDKERDAS